MTGVPTYVNSTYNGNCAGCFASGGFYTDTYLCANQTGNGILPNVESCNDNSNYANDTGTFYYTVDGYALDSYCNYCGGINAVNNQY